MNLSSIENVKPEPQPNSEQKADGLHVSQSIANAMLCEVCPERTLQFIDWISEKQYWRAAKRIGHKWFKIGEGGNFSTKELYRLFIKEINETI